MKVKFALLNDKGIILMNAPSQNQATRLLTPSKHVQQAILKNSLYGQAYGRYRSR